MIQTPPSLPLRFRKSSKKLRESSKALMSITESAYKLKKKQRIKSLHSIERKLPISIKISQIILDPQNNHKNKKSYNFFTENNYKIKQRDNQLESLQFMQSEDRDITNMMNIKKMWDINKQLKHHELLKQYADRMQYVLKNMIMEYSKPKFHNSNDNPACQKVLLSEEDQSRSQLYNMSYYSRKQSHDQSHYSQQTKIQLKKIMYMLEKQQKNPLKQHNYKQSKRFTRIQSEESFAPCSTQSGITIHQIQKQYDSYQTKQQLSSYQISQSSKLCTSTFNKLYQQQNETKQNNFKDTFKNITLYDANANAQTKRSQNNVKVCKNEKKEVLNDIVKMLNNKYKKNLIVHI